jgi:predicted PurR-regulated permease PerM
LGSFSISYPIALGGAFLVMIALILLVVNMVAENAAELATQVEVYQQNINAKLQGLIATVAPNSDFSLDKLNDLFNLQKLVGWTTSVISSVTSTLMLIIIYLLFLFAEQSVFDRKFAALFSSPERLSKAQAVRSEVMKKIRIYLSVKTFVSVLTGVLSAMLLALIGVDYAVFWGFIIFLLNYIPTIGSMLGVVFPAVLSLVQFDTSWQFFAVVILLGGLQFAVGNILEPRLMGSSLNLSGLVIMLALAIWGAIWGITGMILSVPIMVVILIICAQFPASRPIAVLLSSKGEV